MQDQLKANKLFMNMVIHDLRSPSENIHHGLTQAKTMVAEKMAKILARTTKYVQAQMKCKVDCRPISVSK
jgi:hypothetical protein